MSILNLFPRALEILVEEYIDIHFFFPQILPPYGPRYLTVFIVPMLQVIFVSTDDRGHLIIIQPVVYAKLYGEEMPNMVKVPICSIYRGNLFP